jgi:hypothetical protein
VVGERKSDSETPHPEVIIHWMEPSDEGEGTRTDEKKDAYRHASYFFGKVSRAVELLATGPGDIKERLCSAGMEILITPPDFVPEHLREDLRWVRSQLMRFGEDGTSSQEKLYATMRRIRKATGVKIAQRIVEIEMRYEDWIEENSRCRHLRQE